MRELRFHPEADEELIEAQAWYEARSEVAAQAFALEIDHAIERYWKLPFGTPAVNVASDASYCIVFHTRSFTARVTIMSSLQLWHIKEGALITGVIGATVLREENDPE